MGTVFTWHRILAATYTLSDHVSSFWSTQGGRRTLPEYLDSIRRLTTYTLHPGVLLTRQESNPLSTPAPAPRSRLRLDRSWGRVTRPPGPAVIGAAGMHAPALLTLHVEKRFNCRSRFSPRTRGGLRRTRHGLDGALECAWLGFDHRLGFCHWLVLCHRFGCTQAHTVDLFTLEFCAG